MSCLERRGGRAEVDCMSGIGGTPAVRRATVFVRFRNGPLFVKSSNCYLAADDEFIKDYIEIKASRDIIVHNLGEINSLYVDKAGEKARGALGDELVVNTAYFKHVLVTAKTLSGTIQREVEKVYQ